jgi:adenosine kinase
MRTLVSGSLAYDRIMNFPGLFGEYVIPGREHEINVSFVVENMNESFGGTAGNIAYTLALLGVEASIVARAGNDFGPYRAWLTEHGVDTGLVEVDDGKRTAFATVMTDRKDNQISAFYPGADGSPHALPERVFEGARFALVAPGNVDDMRRMPKYLRANKIPFVYDPGQRIPTLSSADLQNGMEGSKALVANDYEMAMIREKTGLDEEGILEKTETVVTTLGEKGSRIRTRKDVIEVPSAKPRTITDPTGAGDAYRAGFVYALMNDMPLPIAGKLASVIACYTVELPGTQTHSFTKIDVAKRYRENYDEDISL